VCRASRSWFTLLLLTTICALAVAGPLVERPAKAAEPAEIENLIRQGVELRQKNKDQAALPFFQRAYDLERSPRTAAQLGLVELSLGYAIAAERHLAEALSSPHHLWVTRNRPQLEVALTEAQKAIAKVIVTGNPRGAEVVVNGQLVGTLPLTEAVAVPEGTVQILVRGPGFEPNAQTLKIPGGSSQSIEVSLKRSTSGADATRRRGTRSDDNALTASQSAPGIAPAWVRPAAWTAGALALTAVTLGVYELWRARQTVDDFNHQMRADTGGAACDVGYVNYGPPPCRTLFEDANDRQSMGITALGIGTLLVGASVVGLLWSQERGAPAGTHAAVGFSRGGLTATWGRRF
jgi:hypothetical protein